MQIRRAGDWQTGNGCSPLRSLRTLARCARSLVFSACRLVFDLRALRAPRLCSVSPLCSVRAPQVSHYRSLRSFLFIFSFYLMFSLASCVFTLEFSLVFCVSSCVFCKCPPFHTSCSFLRAPLCSSLCAPWCCLCLLCGLLFFTCVRCLVFCVCVLLCVLRVLPCVLCVCVHSCILCVFPCVRCVLLASSIVFLRVPCVRCVFFVVFVSSVLQCAFTLVCLGSLVFLFCVLSLV